MFNFTVVDVYFPAASTPTPDAPDPVPGAAAAEQRCIIASVKGTCHATD